MDTEALKPALADISTACDYLGGISRSLLYRDYLPKLETVQLGGRRLVVVASMDRLIENLKETAAA
jgi:hypothetical protein